MRAAHDDAQAQAVPLSPELARCMEAGLRRVPGQRSGGSAGVGETSEVQAWEAPHEVVRTRIKLSELQRPSTTAAKQRPLATVPHESPPNVSDASPSIDRETGHDASSPVAGRKDTPQRRGGSSPRQPSQRGAAEATFDAGELFDALDRNKDGVVDRIEFEAAIRAAMKQHHDGADDTTGANAAQGTTGANAADDPMVSLSAVHVQEGPMSSTAVHVQGPMASNTPSLVMNSNTPPPLKATEMEHSSSPIEQNSSPAEPAMSPAGRGLGPAGLGILSAVEAAAFEDADFDVDDFEDGQPHCDSNDAEFDRDHNTSFGLSFDEGASSSEYSEMNSVADLHSPSLRTPTRYMASTSPYPNTSFDGPSGWVSDVETSTEISERDL